MGNRNRGRGAARTATLVFLPRTQTRRMRFVRQCAVPAESGAAQRQTAIAPIPYTLSDFQPICRSGVFAVRQPRINMRWIAYAV